MITNNEKQWLRKNRRFIEPILNRRIEEYKNLVIDIEDEEKRDKYIKWIKEFKYWIAMLKESDKDEGDKFTGI